MNGGVFGWSYPPGVSGNEPELTGEWQCGQCGKRVNDETSCQIDGCSNEQYAADHCSACCEQEEADADTIENSDTGE